MSNVLSAAYPWIKALHLVAVVSWMAGLLYLPRLFVYHAERGAPGSELSETFKVMEQRLLRRIMRPAMIATWVLGLTPGVTPGSSAGARVVALRQARGRAGADRVPRLAGAAVRRLRGGPQPGFRPDLPAGERGADRWRWSVIAIMVIVKPF